MADPWCNPTSMLKLPLSPAALRTFVFQPLYMSCISLTYFSGMLRSLMHLQICSLGTRSYAFSISMKVTLMSFWPSRCFFYCLLKDEYRIRGASSWHKSKLAFMNFRALSQPSVDHLLPYFEGVCEQFDASVILTLLNVTLFFEMGTRMLFCQADGMHSVVMILLKSLQSVTTPNCPRHFHTSTGISSLPTALPHFIPFSALSLSLPH